MAVGLRRRTRRDRAPIPGRPSNLVGRYGPLAGGAVRVGSGLAADSARKLFADAERRDAIDQERMLQSVEQVAVMLGDMKGALMKLGQLASFLDPNMAPKYRDLLQRLQHDVPPMAPALAEATVEQELGAPLAELFAEWDPMPIAAASIGQVHRALTHDGRALAVKVQYPGVDDAIRTDLAAAEIFGLGLRKMFPGVNAKELLAEVRERITEELDYRMEADNQERFAAAYEGHPHIHVPRVHRDLSTARVLSTDLATGHRFSELASWSQHERDLAGETIYRFVLGSLDRLYEFNGDPHPGNYLFHGGGRVTFLDYGMVKRFEPDELAPFTAMVKMFVVDRDLVGFRRAVEEAGFLPPDADLTDDEIADYFAHFYEYLSQDGPFTFTRDYAQESLRRYFLSSADHRSLVAVGDVPKDLVILQRIQLGLTALLGDLNATANWVGLSHEWWPWMEGEAEPTTPLSIADHEWRVARGAARLLVDGAPRPFGPS